MTEPELQKKLDCWSGDHSAEYAALLNDLAQLKLLKGDTSEAQKLFQSALLVGQKPTQEVQSPEEAEEDWESSWESSLQQLQQKQQAAQAKPVKTSKVPTADKQQNWSLPPDNKGNQDTISADACEIPYESAHLIECCGISQHANVLKLESFLTQQQWPSVAPVVRPVTDTHAVVVCANPADARSLLKQGKQAAAVWQFKPFSEACLQCQAVSPAELQPPQLRQRTTTAVARRLIGNALNVAAVHDKGAERELKMQRTANKAAKAEKARQLEATWGED